MRRSGLLPLITFTVLVLALLLGVVAAGWKPLLGLDLQGGVAVVLKPTTEADTAQINEAVNIIRERVDAIGVAEPDITVQGNSVVVQLPGVKDRERALELVGTTAELRFRPVLQVYLPPGDAAPTTSTVDGSATTGTGSTLPTDASATSAVPDTTTAPPTSAAPPTSSEQGLGPIGTGEQALGLPVRQAGATTAPSAATTSTSAATTSTSAPATETTAEPATTVLDPTVTSAVDPGATTTTAPGTPSLSSTPDITSREGDVKDQQVVLPQVDDHGTEEYRYLLGPTLVTGDALVAQDTQATLNPNTGEWFVQITFKDGDQNVGAWRRAALACYNASDPTTCPTGQLAAVLDGVVISAPQVNDTFQSSNDAVITGRFTQREAKDLAQKLRYGALPVEFERQQSQDVSATVGRDALRAGVAAGLIGLLIVAAYIVAYYKLFGLVALYSLVLSFGMLWVIIAYLGETRGLALSLSGVVGIIVSIGISIDSNIVYFEQIKDDVAGGRNLRSSSQRAFKGAMSTIIKADLVSLIGAGLLYLLTVGPVKGFALFLGLSGLLDLVASLFVMKPAVVWLSKTELAQRNPRAFGIPAPRVAAEVAP